MAKAPQAEATFDPNYQTMVEILANPRQAASIRPNPNEVVDGAFDMDAAKKGQLVKTVTADIPRGTRHEKELPAAIPFVCSCGHVRRVVDSERNFTCESGSCSLFWQKQYTPTDDLDPETGDPIMEPVTKQYTSKKGDTYLLPVIVGRPRGAVVREEMKRRREAKQEDYAQPQGPTSQERAEAKSTAQKWYPPKYDEPTDGGEA